MAVGLMDIKGQYAELQGRIETSRAGGAAQRPRDPRAQRQGFEDEAAAFMGTAGAVGVANGTDGLTIALRALGIGAGDEVITVTVHLLRHGGGHRPGRRQARVHRHPAATRSTWTPAIEAAVTPRHQGDHAGRPLRPAGRRRRHRGDRRGARPGGRRRRLPGLGRDVPRPPRRQPRRPGRLQLLPHQEPRRLRRRRSRHRPRCRELVQKARELRFHGSKDKKTFTEIGFNSRLDEVQAAILRIELEVIDDWNARRALVAEWYDEYLPDEVVRPAVPDGVTHVYHLYVLRHPRRDDIAAACKERQVDCAAYYTTPLQLQPAFAATATSSATSPSPTRRRRRTSPSRCTPTSPRSRSRKSRPRSRPACAGRPRTARAAGRTTARARPAEGDRGRRRSGPSRRAAGVASRAPKP